MMNILQLYTHTRARTHTHAHTCCFRSHIVAHLQNLLICKAVVGEQRDWVARCIHDEDCSKSTLIDKLVERSIFPPDAEDVIRMRNMGLCYNNGSALKNMMHRKKYFRDVSSNSHQYDSPDSCDNGYCEYQDDTSDHDTSDHELDDFVSIDENDTYMGWSAPFQVLWDTSPTYNRKNSELVCL